MKEKLPVIIGSVAFLFLCGFGLYFVENYEEFYYTQVDNTKIEKLSKNEYEYTLIGYRKDGKKRKFRFKTSRELREDAYLELDIRITGVYSWKEVQYEEIPEKARDKYEK